HAAGEGVRTGPGGVRAGQMHHLTVQVGAVTRRPGEVQVDVGATGADATSRATARTRAAAGTAARAAVDRVDFATGRPDRTTRDRQGAALDGDAGLDVGDEGGVDLRLAGAAAGRDGGLELE